MNKQTQPSELLAEVITKSASKQTDYAIRYFVDRDRVNDAYRAYGYFQWVDDVIDDDVALRDETSSNVERNQDTLIAIIPVGHMSENGEQDWVMLREEARRQVFRRLASVDITGLRSHIKIEITFTPLSWRRRYNLMKGSTHGLCHCLMQLGYFRPGNRHAQYHNLYFTGASTRSGTGMPTVMVSGRQSEQRIMDDRGIGDL